MGFGMSRRGQVTIEALLIIGFFIIILIGVSVPMAWDTKRTAEYVTAVADAKYAVEQIASAANGVVTPGSKRTVEVWIPAYSPKSVKTEIELDAGGGNITATVTLPDGDREIKTELYGGGWTLVDAGTCGDDTADTKLTVDSGRGERCTATITWDGTKTITFS